MSEKMCPIGTMYKELNLANHVAAITLANYGPADTRESNPEFWMAKQNLWEVQEGVARMRVCASCHHHDRSPEVQDCIIEGPGGELDEQDVPANPVFVDVPGTPVWYCHRWNMTINPTRVCDNWEQEDQEESHDYNHDSKSLEEKAETYKPTTGMASAARRALKWKDEGHRGGTRVGLARANQLVRRENLTASTVMRMYSFFSRHEVDKKATGFNSGEEGFPSPGRVAWDLWGGDGGYTWSKSKRDQIMRAREG